jgi:hypothetical protein
MPKKDANPEVLRRKERVVVTTDLPGLPEGTAGKVIVVEGLTWIRYWVRFDNGVVRGSLNRKHLARPSEWTEILRRRELGEDDTADAAASSNGDSGAAPAAAEGESVMVNGIPVPAHLIERSKARREFLGV